MYPIETSETIKSMTHQIALNFCNDSCRLGLCLFHQPDLLALSCVQLALGFLAIDEKHLMDDFEHPTQWLLRCRCEVLDDNLSLEDVQKEIDLISTRILLVYKKDKNAPQPRQFVQRANYVQA